MDRRSPCYASCPPSTVAIQPPPFVLTIPGPALFCPNQLLQITQHNPCARGGMGVGGRAMLSDFIDEDLSNLELEPSSRHRSALATLYRSRMAFSPDAWL
ncbi:glycine-rich cell wall structural protein-like [Crotalus adamanteus]|uniref:Glycine-rich cell wall structural protein-like n=1 Tax=Crotalus adamanteus TaxID=8729 RepID=A0AAW1ALS4_CROAD